MTHPTDLLWSCDASDQGAFRLAAIATAAYVRAQRRGLAPGHELEDWLAAEHEVSSLCLQPIGRFTDRNCLLRSLPTTP